MKTLKLLSFFIVLYTSLWSQDPYHINYNTKEGLPSSEVYDMAIDADGLLWFTTDRGVCTYDGYEFTTYTTKDGLSNNTNFEIFEDPYGRFWFTGLDGSLSYFENGQFFPFKHNKILKSLTRRKWITDFIWHNDEVVFSKRHDRKEYHIINIETGAYSKHLIEETKNLHSTGAHGKNYVKSFGDQILFYNEYLKYGENPIQLKNSELKLATAQGRVILIKEQSAEEFNFHFRFPTTLVDYIHQDQNNHLWLCTHTGLFLFKNSQLDQEPSSYFKDLTITSIMMDREGNYWVSSLEKGIFFIPSFTIENFSFDPLAPDSEKIMSIGKLSEHLLFGTSHGRLFTLNRNNKNTDIKLIHSKGQIDDINIRGNHAYVEQFNFVEKGNELIIEGKSKYGISNFPLSNGLLFNISPTGYSIAKNNEVLFRTKIKNSIISEKRVTALAENENNSLLLGTMEGLYLLNPNDYENVVDLSGASPLLNTRISDIHPLGNESIWMATIGNGLLYQNKDSVVQISQEDGLNSNLVNKITLQGDSIIWVGSNKGLNKVAYRMVNQLPEITAIEGYTTTDGLLSNFINDLNIWEGDLWLALNTGINCFKPDLLTKRTVPPHIKLDSVLTNKNNKIVSAGETLPHDLNDVFFHFKSICFSKPESKPFYRYSLTMKGATDENWIYTNEQIAHFANLAAGEYQFTVTARNNNNIWAEATPPFSFEISHHYTETLWFRALAVLFSGLVISIFLIGRNHQLKQDKKLQEALYRTKDAELSALRSQMNPHFVFNALNAIQNYIFKNDTEKANYYLAKFSRLIRSSLELSKLEYIPLSSEIEFLQNYMELEQMRFPDKFDFQLNVQDGLNGYLIPPLLIQPILENSVKYAFDDINYKGLVTLHIKEHQAEKSILIIIEDNGLGINNNVLFGINNNVLFGKNKMEKEHQSFGLEIIRDRIKLLNEDKVLAKASFNYNNKKVNSGLRTELVIPIK